MKKKWYKKMSNWLTIFFFILIIPLMIIFGTIMIKSKIYPDKLPDFMGYKPLIVLSGSMEDEIHVGDLAIVKMVDSSILKEKDIIAYRNSDNTMTLHRIIEIKNEDGIITYVTKGDKNNTSDDENVTNKNIEGLYLFKISNIGNILIFIQQPFVLIIICMIIICFGTLLTIYFNRKK